VAGILIQNSTASITDNTLYANVSGRMYSGQVVISGFPSHVSVLQGNLLYSLQPNAWTLDAADRNRLGVSNDNYFFNPYLPSHISVDGTHTLAEWRTLSGQDADSTEAWFSLASGKPPNSQLFYNDNSQTRTIDLGNSLYKDLDQNPVYGSLTLPPYGSKVLVVPEGLPDLTLTMLAVGSTDTAPSAPVSYTLAVSNQGTGPASGIVLTNLVPAAISDSSWQASIGGVSVRNGSRYVWDLPDLATGEAITITVSGKYVGSLNAGTPVASAAGVSAATPEVITSNNQASLLFGTWRKMYLPLVQQ
jgi:uncharacterized repeat protein (TIGR01451 family)